jgi:hypothetical protein
MCAIGPPNDVDPSLRKTRNTSKRGGFTGLGDKVIADEVRLDVEVVLQPQGPVSASK